MPLIDQPRTNQERDEFLLYLLEYYDRIESEDTVETITEQTRSKTHEEI
jgi:hypothetical protein